MGNSLCCCCSDGATGLGRPPSAQGHNSISRQLDQRLANYRATGIVPLRDAKLQALPAFVEQLGDKVKTLDVTNNFLSELPASIESNYNLTRLVVAKNGLVSLPIQLGLLSNLKLLTLDDNKLVSLPREICGLERLESLSVNGNELVEVPNEIGQLRHLKTLSLSRNRLTVLPAELGRCSALEDIAASNNHLKEIPTELGGLDRLKTADFDSNRIEAVPSSVLIHCLSLQTLSLHNNPITPAALQGTEGFEEFESRRRTKFDKMLAAGVLLGPRGLDEGVDRNATRQ
mmetsp:Transcript_112/g.386  ORF Transcript_112/g.386 Transcript_112/m.386 type:complete len:287 (+) Transcript_112:196-1056(+)